MPDPYVPLPDDDESVDALTSDFDDYMRTAVPGWEPSDGAVEVAMRAAFADEASTLYSLVRDRADDEWRDYGNDILGLPPGEAAPATTSVTVTARDTAGYTLDAGETIVIDAPTGRAGFEVVTATTIAPGASSAAGVLIQALDAGTAGNGLTGPILFDEQPAWISTMVLDAQTSGGTDAEADADYLDRVRRAAQLLSRAPILADDYELVAQEVPTIARALVRDNYDELAGTGGHDLILSVYPIDADGESMGSGPKADLAALYAERCIVNTLVRIGDATYTTIDVALTVSALEGEDHTDLATAVAAAITGEPLNPALFGQPPLGERLTWLRRTLIRLYEIAAVADRVEGVYDVTTVTLGKQWAVTAAAATDLLTVNAHGFTANDPVTLSAITGGAGLTAGTTYYIRDLTTNTFKVAATPGGAAINITTDLTVGTLHRLAGADITLAGSAPLPRAGVVTVTVVDPT